MAEQQATTPRKKKRGRHKKKAPNVYCRLCGRGVKRLVAAHLKSHGWTFETYIRTFNLGDAEERRWYVEGEVSAPPAHPSRASGKRPTQANTLDRPFTIAPGVLDVLTDELIKDRSFVERIANDVSGALFRGSAKHQLRLAICSLIHTRLAMHGRAVELLENARKELLQPWRLQKSGPGGQPPKTAEIVAVMQAALAEVKTSEDLLVKTVKLAIDEGKKDGTADTEGSLDRYTGEAERIPVPAGLTPLEREGVRNLISMLENSVRKRRAIEGEIVQREPAQSTAPAEYVPIMAGDSVPAEFDF